MTDHVTDVEKTSPTDIDGDKRMKFESRRYKLVKVYTKESPLILSKEEFRWELSLFLL